MTRWLGPLCAMGRQILDMKRGRESFHDPPLGRQRGRIVASSPNRFAMRRTQLSSPKGRPRCTLRRSASNSTAVCGRFTSVTQCRGRSIVHALSQVVSFESPCVRRHPLDHGQSSARPTSFARSALRSTYRATVKECSRPAPETI